VVFQPVFLAKKTAKPQKPSGPSFFGSLKRFDALNMALEKLTPAPAVPWRVPVWPGQR
jgi:hypothetical protein